MQILQLRNPGILYDKIPFDLFTQIKEGVFLKRQQSDTYNNFIKSKLQILSIKEIDEAPYSKEFEIYILEFFKKWCEVFNVECSRYEIQSVWTNYMKPAEFAPMHKHTPSLASFVIWIQIPYFLEEEKRYHFENGKLDQTNRNGAFQFMYSNICGGLETRSLDLQKSDEGTIIMFPGDLMHCVYPFFSKEQERISIAGNIYSLDSFDILKKP